MGAEKISQTGGEAKISEYIARIQAGESKEELLNGLPQLFVEAINKGLESQTETLSKPEVTEPDLRVNDSELASQKAARAEEDAKQLIDVRKRLGIEQEVNTEKFNISLPNLDDVISKGGGQVEVFSNGNKVDFEEFAVGIDKDNNQAEVLFIRKKDPTQNKGIGVALYIELGKRLAEKGITLWSSNAQYGPGRDLWLKLSKLGMTERTNSGFKFLNK